MAAAGQKPHVSAVCPRSYQDESYLHGFLGTVGDLQKDGAFQDVVLEVEGRRFPCHRLVLSAASPYFRAMFTSDMAESRQKTVVLQGLEAGMFGDILSYIYSGTLRLSLDKVQPLYQAADLLQLDYVRDTCSSYMAMNVECSTCVDLYKFADVFSVDIVRKRCLQWIAKHFTEIASSEDFCSLGVNQLTEIISNDELDVKEETTVWEAVVRWVQHSREDRLHHLPSILPHIRFNLLTSDDTAAILDHPLVRENPGSSTFIGNVVQKGNPNLKPRLGMTTEMAILSNAFTKELLFMNPREGKYISCNRPEDFPRDKNVTVTSGNNIYILTRDQESNEPLSVYKYNHAGSVWEDAGMSSISRWQRHEIDFTWYNEYLFEVDQILYYLAADVREDSGLVWMWKCNRHTDHWQECSQLQLRYQYIKKKTPYMYSAALSCSSQLYFLTSAEVHCYNPSQNRWFERTPPMIIDQVCTAVAMGTEIFCTDFHNTQTLLYDTESDCWQKLQGWPNPGNHVYNHPYLFVMENQLHIWFSCRIDEDDIEEKEHLVYVYDRSAGAWTDLKAVLPSNCYVARSSHCPVARIYLPYLKGE
ncbi:kelch repeat and BTB domain-containing protein 8-like [Branchiostoma floridae]|uniref:Kelch repeat and BTB domain-containing protein 8-like n=1 Tax=Branchiostoma floridae TaxID=7739 RepID=A0A9J7N1I6_BRAFL|nr:kelch repeat and BTB domain-containing protein 8-like [Branchiostoma floridae]